jgi:hypothetical protein
MSAMVRGRIELLVALVLGALAVVTALWPAWFETLTGLEPDGGSGSFEWAIVAALTVAALAAALLGRRDVRAARIRAQRAGGRSAASRPQG